MFDLHPLEPFVGEPTPTFGRTSRWKKVATSGNDTSSNSRKGV